MQLHALDVRVRGKGSDRQVQVASRAGSDTPVFTEEVPFDHPFGDKVLEEIRWYLEDYLKYPEESCHEKRAHEAQQEMRKCGRQLFQLVFGSGRAFEYFNAAVRDGLRTCEVVISADDPAVLALPWELMYCDDYQYLAFKLGGLCRSLNMAPVKPITNNTDNCLNVLLVICRPNSASGMDPLCVARRVLDSPEMRLKIQKRCLSFTVLRPPTIVEFVRELDRKRGFYQVVHFDGGGRDCRLEFETDDGEGEWIAADRIGQHLYDCGVRLFLLHASRSAKICESFSSVASQMIRAGAKGVVAMAYKVSAEGACVFMVRLYEELILGNTICSAVASGRRQLHIEDTRTTPTGRRSMQDWMVPVIYQQERYIAHTPRDSTDSTDPYVELRFSQGAPPAGRYGFIGRDYEMHELGLKFRRKNCLVHLMGDEGRGKTELARGWARWLIDTNGVREIAFTDLKKIVGLKEVKKALSESLAIAPFDAIDSETSLRATLQSLRETKYLIVWDGLDHIGEIEDVCSFLVSFLKMLVDGTWWILLISRNPLPWLEEKHRKFTLEDMSESDARVLAKEHLEQEDLGHYVRSGVYMHALTKIGRNPLLLVKEIRNECQILSTVG